MNIMSAVIVSNTQQHSVISKSWQRRNVFLRASLKTWEPDLMSCSARAGCNLSVHYIRPWYVSLYNMFFIHAWINICFELRYTLCNVDCPLLPPIGFIVHLKVPSHICIGIMYGGHRGVSHTLGPAVVFTAAGWHAHQQERAIGQST